MKIRPSMSGRWLNGLIIAVISLALCLRVFQLGHIPHGLTWDEAAIGYNGFSVWQVHRDEWLNFMPLSFRSFGDYKAPAAIYITGLFTTILGLTPLAVRLPFVLAGIAAVIGMFGLVRSSFHVFAVKENQYLSHVRLALLASLFLACSPWHILFSRVGFESGMALTALIWATWFLYLSIAKQTAPGKWKRSVLWLSSAILFSVSPYIYHSAKVFTPLFVIALLLLLLRKKLINLKQSVAFCLVFCSGLAPLLYDAVFGHALERGGVTVFSQSSSIPGAIASFGHGFVTHLIPSFLLLGQTDNLRHSTGIYGVLSLVHAALLLVFLAILGISLLQRRALQNLSFLLFGVLWLVMGIVPAAIGVEVPHPNRALLALPGFILVAIWTVTEISRLVSTRYSHDIARRFAHILILMIVLGELLSAIVFSWIYFGQYQQQLAKPYLSGYLEAAKLAYQYSQGDGYPEVDQVLFTSTYGQPYIFVLFANHLDSIAYHNGVLVKFLFPDRVSIADLSRKNALVVSGQDDKIDAKPEKILTDSYGEPRFYFYLSQGAE